ncbi:hypothetical protein KAU18_03555 [Candidatus Bathyarchaeota archaeon]|nr:hypothetical protein [Candidatus Bathyarchaeota archaeon]MCK4702022.1 hypothetical protein [Candidatus Bathyarchaeota archaeon]
MFGPITKEESLRHLRNALELEMDRLHLAEAMTQRRARLRAISRSIMEERSATAEMPSDHDWRKVLVSVALSRDRGPKGGR